MNARSGLPWPELLELRAVVEIAHILDRRWSLGLGYAEVDSHAAPPRMLGHTADISLCGVIQGHEAGLRACRATAVEAARRPLEAAAACGERTRAPAEITCHAGLHELVAPIAIEGLVVGVLVCGGYLRADESRTASGGAELVDRRTAPLALDPAAYTRARAGQPHLDRDAVALAGDLLMLAAGEIAAHIRDSGLLSLLPLRQRGLTPPIRPPAPPRPRRRYADIIGASPPMQELYAILDRVVQTDSTVLIQGENGTGKELVARAIHDHSSRRERRFVVTNCSAFHDNLLDSELFGHVKGAFTGAVADKPGLFEAADQGTFFLDEIGDMTPALQVKVLRVLQEGTFTPVGSTEMRRVDVRIIAATNRDLDRMVEEGSFREDLYYRVNVINLRVPPLRERPGDIELLVAHFLDRHRRDGAPAKALSPACLERLRAHDWPGNVRELENEIERLVVFAGDAPYIDETVLSRRVGRAAPARPAVPAPATTSLPQALRALERRMILDALRRHEWNKTRAAAELEISRRNLIRLVQKYDLEAERED